jgi:hypothetical protein
LPLLDSSDFSSLLPALWKSCTVDATRLGRRHLLQCHLGGCALSKSTRRRSARKADRPSPAGPGIPLSPHASGNWQKKINGKLYYFGRWGRVVNGRQERVEGDGWKEALAEYKETTNPLVGSFGKDKAVDVQPADLPARAFQRKVMRLVTDNGRAQFPSPGHHSAHPGPRQIPIRVIKFPALTLHPMSGLHTNRYRELVRRLRAAREQAGLKQTDVAEALRKPQSFVSKIELCERRLDPIELIDLAALYGVDLPGLLAGLEGDRNGKGKQTKPRRPDRKDRARCAGEG